MKKLYLLAALIMLNLIAQAQWQFIPSGTIWTTTDNVGIGTDSPLHILDIKSDNPTFYITATSNNRSIKISPSAGLIDSENATLYLNRTTSNNVSMVHGGGNVGIGTNLPQHILDIESNDPTFNVKATSNNRSIKIKPSAGIINSENTTLHLNRSTTSNVSMAFGGGNVGIGVLNATTKLDVRGKISTEEIKVEIIDGMDFVFSDDYKLESLASVENYIKANKHLPEIASEQEMQENGLEVGKFQMQLLQKIEELTLYIINQQKEIKTLQEKVVTLEKVGH